MFGEIKIAVTEIEVAFKIGKSIDGKEGVSFVGMEQGDDFFKVEIFRRFFIEEAAVVFEVDRQEVRGIEKWKGEGFKTLVLGEIKSRGGDW